MLKLASARVKRHPAHRHVTACPKVRWHHRARGGDLGTLTVADLADEVRAALDGLEVAGVSDVVVEGAA